VLLSSGVVPIGVGFSEEQPAAWKVGHVGRSGCGRGSGVATAWSCQDVVYGVA
jgi:hypothetical protein